MAISFPVNPTLNQTYVYNSRTWAWNGTNWNKITTVITTPMLADSSVTTAKIADLAVTPAKLSASVIASISQGSTPKITTIVYPGNDLAADIAGSQTITLNGLNFVSGCTVFVGATQASVVTFISTTQVTFTSPAKTAASYTLYLINPDGGTATAVPGLSYSGTPAWSTASGSIDTQFETQSFSDTVGATGDGSITYSLLSGTLPTGSSLNTTTGIISGTSPAVANSTTYSFVIRATDAQLQDSDRSFSITINPDVVTWSSPADSSTVVVSQNLASSTALAAASAVGQSITYTANTLPIGLSIVGSAVTGTPTTLGTTSSTFTATAAVTGKFATRTFNWSVAVTADTYFNLTTLLLQGDTAPTYISDASSNTFEINPFGTVKSDTSQPFQEGYYSGYFDGNADYLNTISTAAAALGTTYTIECFIYRTGTASVGTYTTVMQLINTQPYGTALTGFMLTFDGGNVFNFRDSSGTIIVSTSDTNLALNTWIHVAIVRNGSGASNVTMYLNGASIVTGTSSGTQATNQTMYIGGDSNGNCSFPGYISNLRIVKGVAVYTAAFTPPTAPLTITQSSGTNISAITGTDTSLLTLQSNRFKDQTAANLAITTAGTPAIKTLQPFTLPITWATYGSGYFNGSTDYLTAPYNAVFNFGTGDFTLEAWVYITSFSAYSMIAGMATGVSSQRSWYWYTDITTGLLVFGMYEDGVNAIRLTSSTGVKLNTWNHIATTRVTGTTYHYINGTQVGTIGTQLGSIYVNAAAVPTVGREAAFNGSYFPGYISNLRIVKGTAVYTGNFTPPTAPLTAIANTSLLTLQYKQGSNNNGFQDSSQNNSLITRVGTPTQGTFTPYGGSRSNSFSASQVYLALSPASTNFNLIGDFTLEAYVFPTIRVGGTWGILDARVSGATAAAWVFSIDGNGKLTFYDGSAKNGATTITLNTWHHVAWVRNGSVLRGYLDGVLDYYNGAYGSSAVSPGSTAPYVGTKDFSINSDYGTPGYLSDLRVVIGTAVYTTSSTTVGATIFTPSTTPLTPITNTVLLTCQSRSFVDNSPNAFTVAPSSSTISVQNFSPFAPTAAYDAATNGGTAYFNGTTDYLTAPANSFTTGGNWTIECWGYSTSSAGTEIILNGLASDRLYIEWVGGSLVVGDAVTNTLSTGSIKLVNQWYHLAVVKSGTAYTAYLNGVSVGTSTTALITATLTTWQIGARTAISAYFPGYLSNVRIVKGTAVYTGTFTPPTAPLTASGATSAASYPSTTNVNTAFPASNTSLLLNGTNGGIIDATSKNLITAAGDARVSTAQKKYGTASMYFDGTGDYLSLPSNMGYSMGTGDFTIEMWAYPTSGTNNGLFQISSTAGGFVTTGLNIAVASAASTNIQVNLNSTAYTTTTGGIFPLNTWTHIALVRSSGVSKLYVNGTLNTTIGTAGAITDASNYTGTYLVVGGYYTTGYVWIGYIDDLRITKYARYTANFTPPAVSFVAR